MATITLADLLAAGGSLHGAAAAHSFRAWSYDSRLTTPGSLFVALRTARADGHEYIAAALAAGAAGVVCTWPPADSSAATVILSPDPQALLLNWASAHLARLAPTVVAVTGSVGKTTTRRAIAAVLARIGPTFQSRRSFNSLFGLPIALAQLEHTHRFAVLEFGSDRRGEIATLARRFPPQIGVVTAIGPAHLRSFGSLEAIVSEKGDLPAALPSDGWAILNADDPQVAGLAARTSAQVLTYGRHPSADLRLLDATFGLAGSYLQVAYGEQSAAGLVPLLGAPGVTAALAALAVGLACRCDLASSMAALADLAAPAGRLRPLPAMSGAIILDDSFSAALPGMQAALATLAALPAQRRLAILGPPSDLADDPATSAMLGDLAAHSADRLIFVGNWAVAAAQAARAVRPDLPIDMADTATAAAEALPDDLGSGDLLLLKGDPALRLERIAAGLLADQVDREQVLVRQEPVWRQVRVADPGRPTWVQIDLEAIAANVRSLRAHAGVPLMIVLKGDAYGHGAVRAARAALRAGAQALAVATLGEARMLREQAISAPILVLGYTPPWQAGEALRLDLDCTVFDDDAARALSDAALALERRARIHVKIDTGMARLGLEPAAGPAFLRRLRELPGLEVAGLYTHFAGADLPDLRSAEQQLARFQQLLAALTAAGLRPPLVHAANSAATLRMPAARFDMVRPGIACYGLTPTPNLALPIELRPALSFYSEVAQVREHRAGTPISYGGAYVTPQTTQIATLPVGYADGLRRSPAWREVLIRGQVAPIVGRICMDYVMVDVGHIPGVRRGDPVVLIGSQGDNSISADQVAGWLGTISYEVLTGILPRVPREVSA